MPQPDAALFAPLAVALATTMCTIPIHATGVSGIFLFLRRERKRGFTGTRFAENVLALSAMVTMALISHLGQMALWAGVFIVCGEFDRFSPAFYHSAMNYTTLGYGDIVMSPHWRLLGPLEAANGVLMFGVSTAALFAIILRFVETRLHIEFR